jgi:hypothetical protein
VKAEKIKLRDDLRKEIVRQLRNSGKGITEGQVWILLRDLLVTTSSPLADDEIIKSIREIYTGIFGSPPLVRDPETEEEATLITEIVWDRGEYGDTEGMSGSSPFVTTTDRYGGIDLNQALLELKTSGKGFTGYDPVKLKEISANIAGFRCEILSIKRSGN